MASSDIELLLAYLDGSLPLRESVLIESRLKSEAPLAELLLKLSRDEAIVAEWSATVESVPGPVSPQRKQGSPSQPLACAAGSRRPVPRPGRLIPIAIAASALLATSLSLYFGLRESKLNEQAANLAQDKPPEAKPGEVEAPANGPVVGRLEDVQGEAFLVSGKTTSPLIAGQDIHAGQQVKTGDGGVAVVQLADSSRLELGSDTHLTFVRARDEMIDVGLQLFLTSGTIHADVASQATGKQMTLTTPHATIKGDHTRFSSVAAGETTSVEMESGKVEMTMSNGEQVSVPEGRVVVTGKKIGVSSDRTLPSRVTIPRKTLLIGTGPVVSLAANPVDNHIAINTWDATVLMYDVAAEKWLPPIGDHLKRINAMAFSRDGKLLASGGEDRTVQVRRVSDQKEHISLRKQRTNVHALAFAHDGKTLATASGVYKGFADVFLWNAETGTEIGSLPGHPNYVNKIAFHPMKEIVVTACRDGFLRVWSSNSLKLLGSYSSNHSEPLAIAFSPDGKRLATAGREGLVKLWDTETWTADVTLEGHLGEVCSIAFSPDGKRLASCGMLTTIWLWDVESAMPVRNYVGHKFKVTSVAFSADGKTLITSGWDRTVKLWNVEP